MNLYGVLRGISMQFCRKYEMFVLVRRTPSTCGTYCWSSSASKAQHAALYKYKYNNLVI